MKIVFFTNNMAVGGAQRVISVLSERFCRMGHDVCILEEGHPYVAYDLHRSVRLLKLNECVQPRKTFFTFLMRIIYKILFLFLKNQRKKLQEKYYYFQQANLLKDYFKRYSADIIYSFLVEQNIMLGLAAKRINSRIIISERNFPDRANYSDSFKRFRNRCYKRADVCVFQTEDQKKFFPKSVQNKSTVIFNPIKEDLPEVYYGKRKKIIVNYCRFHKQKNLPLLISAFSKIAHKYQEYHLLLFGRGRIELDLQRMIDDLSLTDRVKLQPFDPELHSKIVDYAMFVMTSDYEGMPNSLIEAMGIGLPCISTDCDGGGARAVIEDGVNGLLVPKGDVEAVAAAMEDLILHPKKAERLSKNAVKIREKLAVDRIAEQWLKLAE